MKAFVILFSLLGAACALSDDSDEDTTSSTEQGLIKCYFDEWDGLTVCEVGGCTTTCHAGDLGNVCVSSCG